ncbi:hypothetical protein OWR29_39355 [Actinoplanes sp. Pm04-4]|uniref:Uncharacterized protein n=1 Tax=Paractinoplanes pyxinae TaxID=2997416 RepID=A0ABT4BEU3_9ACTN|nr:hypothetical protein [Actinoplanes pyxinae]MCY1144090.1 hypothetical protein [Actinoplanes pyxinae]
MTRTTPNSAAPYFSPESARLADRTVSPSYGAVGPLITPDSRVLLQLRDDKPEIRTCSALDELLFGAGQAMRFTAVEEALRLDLVPFARRLIEALPDAVRA